MLADLLPVRAGLTAAGYDLAGERLHGDIKALSKELHLLVRLQADGSIEQIELLPDELRASGWLVGDGNHNNMPRIKAPMLLAEVDAKKTPPRTIVEMMVAQADATAEPYARHIERAHERIAQIDHPLFSETINALLPLLEAGVWPVMLRWIGEHLDELADDVIRRISNMATATVPVTFLVDSALYSPATRKAVSERLFACASDTSQHVCSLTGKLDQPMLGSVPKRALPGVGGVAAYSRNKAYPCLARYGMNGPDSLGVGQTTVDELDAALRVITDPSREGVTWRTVRRGKGEPDLVLAYTHDHADVGLVDFFAGLDSGDVEAAEADTSEALAGIKAKAGSRYGELPVELMLVRKVNDGAHTVPMVRSLTIAGLEAASERWHRRAATDITLPFPPKEKGGPVRMLSPRPPTPLQIPHLLARGYTRDCRTPDMVEVVSPNDAITFFLDDRRAGHVLRTIVARTSHLLLAVADASHRRTLPTWDRNETHRKAVLPIMAVMMIAARIVRSNNGDDEMTERSVGYQLGQYLAGMNQLHRNYCLVVRSGALPSSLIGSTYMRQAQSRPVAALAALGKRVNVYESWASTLRQPKGDAPEGEDRARYFAARTTPKTMRQIKGLAETLGGNLPAKADALFQAEMLLGFSAGLPAEPASKNGETVVETS